jgi:hypothetical protein
MYAILEQAGAAPQACHWVNGKVRRGKGPPEEPDGDNSSAGNP